MHATCMSLALMPGSGPSLWCYTDLEKAAKAWHRHGSQKPNKTKNRNDQFKQSRGTTHRPSAGLHSKINPRVRLESGRKTPMSTATLHTHQMHLGSTIVLGEGRISPATPRNHWWHHNDQSSRRQLQEAPSPFNTVIIHTW